MKKQNLTKSLLIVLLAMLSITACKKDEPVDQPADSSSAQQLSQDDANVGENFDEVTLDAGLVLANNDLKSMELPCNCTLDSMWAYQDTMRYRLRYHGMNCDQTRLRYGHITIKIHENTQWFMPGAFIIMEFENYEVTNLYNGKTMQINGRSDMQNVSGGVPALLGTGGINAVIYRNTAQTQIRFNGNPPRQWQLRKRTVFSGTPDNLVITIDGFGTADGYNNLLSWGKDRDGRGFYTQVTQAMVHKQQCDFLPSAGEEVFIIPEESIEATATFGFNNSNQAISGNECPTRYKLHWRQHGHSGNVFIPLRGNN